MKKIKYLNKNNKKYALINQENIVSLSLNFRISIFTFIH